MKARYFKRYRMEIDFRRVSIPRAILPSGYRWRAWNPLLLDSHAEAKSRSFHQEMDTQMFASLGTQAGCRELMRGIVHHPGFLAQATWLIEFEGNQFAEPDPCGTIQGLVHSTTLGSIQNVGIVPEHRHQGLGRALVLKALQGFRSYGMWRVYLDVTAENTTAVQLYRSIGFHCISTTYRELPEPVAIEAS